MKNKVQLLPQLVVALDNQSIDQARSLVRELKDVGVSWFKVGLELFIKAGPGFVEELRRQDLHVFLDLKLFDIPNTVAQAVSAAGEIGVDIINVHASGGPTMLNAAHEASLRSKVQVVGVTVLTSFGTDDFHVVSESWGATPATVSSRVAAVHKLAAMTAAAGLHGVVCSVGDLHSGSLRHISWKMGQSIEAPLFITPGIRNAEDVVGDQKQIGTVEDAVRAGSTHLVVGRPITQPASGNSSVAASKFLDQIKRSYGSTAHS